MVVHTNTMGEGDMERYRKIFREQEMISYGEYVEEPPARRTVFGRAGEYLLAAVKRFLVRAL